MIGRFILAIVMAAAVATPLWAETADEGANVTIRGRMHEDKHGFFVTANGGLYDLQFADNAKADMHKFYGGLNGDFVQVTGSLYVDNDDKGKAHMTVYANDITRFKPTAVVTERRVVEPPPVIVREEYVEHRRNGVDLPGIHIHW
ncbi:MAG TPA: hypothetical protein VKX17_25930 [Planctomycetota bacterium]|nr:hypothetical protein [Planctomycetota bacterium]